MQIIADRRALHRIPEPDLRLPKTMAYLERALQNLSCRLLKPAPSSLCAWFDFGAQKTVAFRCDCDALPITEQTEAPYASRHPGFMHACGHDGHMAIGLELARRLSGKASLGVNVLLVFQPAEEAIGGAKPLCDSGIFREYSVEAIFGLHVYPGYPAGTVLTRKGPLMSQVTTLTVDIYGQSAHIGRAWEAIDALAAGMEFYRRVRAFEQGLDPSIPRILNFGRMESGTVRNIISGHTRLEGSIRCYDETIYEMLYENLQAIAREVERETRCRVEITIGESYPPVINDATLVDKARTWAKFSDLPAPVMVSEDFSFYQKEMPGVFFFLGLGDVPSLHSPDFDFDDSLLLKGADFFEALAEHYA